MILSRTENTIRNSFWGLVNRLLSLLIPFFIRTIIIYKLGAEFLGLSSLFTSIFSVLSLAELGFGSAIVYSMYKPIYQNDERLISSLLNYYKKVYKIVGCVILIAGLILIPFIPNLIKGSHPEGINLTLIYLIFLINTVISYSFYAYKNSLLIAHHRVDIINRTNVILNLSLYIIQIIILLVWSNFYLYVIVIPLFRVIMNLLNASYAKKMYPNINAIGELTKYEKKELNKSVLGLFSIKVSSVTRNSIDSIIISSYIGLFAVAVYNNYYYIINAVTGILLVITTSVSAGIGNSLVSETVDKNFNDLLKFNFIYMWITGVCTVLLATLYQPFMMLWVGKDMMLSNSIMLLFVFYFLILKIGDIQAQYFDAAGLWWYGKWRGLFETLANVLLNLILGYFFGIFGILIATIFTVLFINFSYSTYLISKHLFKERIKEYIRNQIFYIIIISITTILIFNLLQYINFKTDSSIQLMLLILIRMILSIVLSNIIFTILFYKTKQFKVSRIWITHVINKFIRKK